MRKKISTHLEINHCYQQKDLVDWKYFQLQDIVRSKPKARKGNGRRIAYRFATRSVQELNPFYELFYGRGKKHIPSTVNLSPLSLAVWFMDDGCKSRTSVYLNTQQFDLTEQYVLINILKQQYGLQSTINRDKCYFRIRIRVESMPLFRTIVQPYLLPTFQYKLP